MLNFQTKYEFITKLYLTGFQIIKVHETLTRQLKAVYGRPLGNILPCNDM